MKPQLFAVLLGGKPPGSTIEQHNVFFGVAGALEDLYPAIKRFWAAPPKIHVDAYMILDHIGDYDVVPAKAGSTDVSASGQKLFFMNLGGYREGVFEEMHKKLFIVAEDESAASKLAKNDPFFQEGILAGKAAPHIDDKHLLDAFEDDAPLDVGQLVAPQGYALSLKKVRSGSSIYPQPIITGFQRIP